MESIQIQEIDAELATLPTTWRDFDGISDRAEHDRLFERRVALVRRRLELVDAERNTPPLSDPLPAHRRNQT